MEVGSHFIIVKKHVQFHTSKTQIEINPVTNYLGGLHPSAIHVLHLRALDFTNHQSDLLAKGLQGVDDIPHRCPSQ